MTTTRHDLCDMTRVGALGEAQTKVAGKARAVRYVQKMVLNIELRDTSGQIFPPFLDITYASADTADYNADKKVEVSGVIYVIYTLLYVIYICICVKLTCHSCQDS